MSYDDILPVIGSFGWHQWKLLILVSFPFMANFFFKVGNVALVISPKYRCMLPFETENASYFLNQTQLDYWYPLDLKTKTHSSCRYKLNTTELNCDRYIFDNSFGRTVAVEFELTCDKDYLIATSNSLNMFGMMIGAIFFGSAADRWGRRKILIITNVIYGIIGNVIIFSPNIWTFLILRVILGMVIAGGFYGSYVILIESTEPSKRLMIGTCLNLYYGLGTILSSLLAYLSPTWKVLQVLFTAFGAPCILYIWVLPESARWLISKNRITEARKIIKIIAKENKRTILEEHLEYCLTEARDAARGKINASVYDAMRYPTLRTRIFILMFLNFVCYIVVFGITWHIPKFSGNVYTNLALMGLSDLPTFVMVLFTAQRAGRRPVIFTYMIISSLCLVITFVKPSAAAWVLTWSLISKLLSGSTMCLIYVLSSELYPTVFRNAGLGLGAIAGSLGGIFASYIFYLEFFWKPLPNIILSGLLLIACGLILLLPETFNKKLPETLEEGNRFGK
ncbi:unnamed protein product [Ceutorhynchus assimilis]|uniref:Major facilitator superfamily (MFS) profile domain-containing protein n=1 Tax=Ceutorhynchus assimilis TaxID=467358 RepID=A0A9N9QMD6_9CUCU|nr:unnamed protein product [Ceutorhynchus assimilis]